MIASQFGREASVRWLLEHGANAAMRHRSGRTALKFAKDAGHNAIV